jgi:hypothetical protein
MAKDTRSTAAVLTPYIIFYRVPEQTGAGWIEMTDENDDLHIVKSRGQEQAMRDALALNTSLAALANSPTGVEVVVLPERSYKPTPIRLVPQDPVVKIG